MHLSAYVSVYSLLTFFFVTTSSTEWLNTNSYGVDFKYILYKCYAQSEAMETLLHQIFRGLNEAIKSIDSMGVLERIIVGAKIPVNGRPKPLYPTITCVNKQEPALAHFAADCAAVPDGRAFIPQKSNPNMIVLCPYFSSLDVAPTRNDCAKLNKARSRLSYSKIGGNTQFSVILHELVHLYLGQPSLGNPGLPAEKYKVNPVMSLPPSQSAINPANYVFFVGNLVAGCTDFPRFTRGRRLSDSTDPDPNTDETAVDGVVDNLSSTPDLDPDPSASVADPWSMTEIGGAAPSATASKASFNLDPDPFASTAFQLDTTTTGAMPSDVFEGFVRSRCPGLKGWMGMATPDLDSTCLFLLRFLSG
ncbi:hypothetical protein MMC13_004927 [Lambiella insularis]|nr:hypothetical protein [Lambiella insularis]